MLHHSNILQQLTYSTVAPVTKIVYKPYVEDSSNDYEMPDLSSLLNLLTYSTVAPVTNSYTQGQKENESAQTSNIDGSQTNYLKPTKGPYWENGSNDPPKSIYKPNNILATDSYQPQIPEILPPSNPNRPGQKK